MAQPRTCVVISYWAARSTANLHKLLGQMQTLDAGCPFDVVVVSNGGNAAPLVIPARFDGLKVRVFNRENTHYNIGAWEHGWRNVEGYEFFLFLQDECFLKRARWLEPYEFRMSRDPGIGLLGEMIRWDQMSWPFIRASTDRDLGPGAWPAGEAMHPIDAYQHQMERRGISKGDEATFLSSIILFTSRKILEEVGGYPLFGLSYRDAVATEVAFSRAIAAKGYRLSRIKEDDLYYISHFQWKSSSLRWAARRDKLRGILRRVGLKRRHRTA